MDFVQLEQILNSNPKMLQKVKSLLTKNRPFKQTEDSNLCMSCQQNPPDWMSICNPCLDLGENSEPEKNYQTTEV